MRIMPEGVGKSGVSEEATVARIASERSPETITSAPSRRTSRKLPPSMETALTSATSRSSVSCPAICSSPSASATSATEGCASSVSSGSTYTGQAWRPGRTAAPTASRSRGSARLTMTASSSTPASSRVRRARSTTSAACSGVRSAPETTATTGVPRLRASWALRSRSAAGSGLIRSVPSTTTTPPAARMASYCSTQRCWTSSPRPSAMRVRASAAVRPPRACSGERPYCSRISSTMGSVSTSSPGTTGRK